MNVNHSPPSDSLSGLTEFGPITPDDKAQGYGYYFTQFFKKSKKSQAKSSTKLPEPKDEPIIVQGGFRESVTPHSAFEHSSSSNSLKTLINDLNATPEGKLSSLSGTEEVSYERTLPNVLTRIKNIIDKKSMTPQQYKDSDFKQHWLPDHLSKECYDCSDKFTALRRRHHCRVCGQIFCSKCCNRMIPGKVIGYKGDLRVCTYCCKVVLTYLQSNNIEEDVLADLKALQEELLPLKNPMRCTSDGEATSHSNLPDGERITNTHIRRRTKFGFMEENYTVRTRCFSSGFPTCVSQKQLDQMSSERQLLLKDSQQLHSLWSQMVAGPCQLALSTNRHRLKAFPDTFIGRDFVQWLLDYDKASSRQSAIAIGQALIEAGFLFCVSQTDQIFVDEHVLYKALKPPNYGVHDPAAESLNTSQDMGQEPLWLKQIPSQVEEIKKGSPPSNVMERNKTSDGETSHSSSTYSLNLNIIENVVSVRGPLKKNIETKPPFSIDQADSLQTSVSAVLNDSSLSVASEQHSSGTLMTEEILQALKTLEPKEAEARAAKWQQQNQLDETEEPEQQLDEQTKLSLEVQKKFNDLWASHEGTLLAQLLRMNGLDLTWSSIILPLIYKVVDTVRPDVKNESDDMDIRQYVQFKKVPGGKRNECRIINGTVCSKNVVHRQMKTRISDPQILLLASHIDFHRSGVESKAFSVENVLLQEEEYTKKVVSKILSYRPDILITGEGISYVAREQLREEGVTLVMNVKTSVIERIARCAQAQIIPSVEDDFLRPAYTNGEMPHRVLGMCHSFYLRSFMVPSSSVPKTLMFFDGCATHLGCTLILRGASNSELKRVKRVTNFMIFALYNWRLERSFLMDEFASVPFVRQDQEPIDMQMPRQKSVEMEDTEKEETSKDQAIGQGINIPEEREKVGPNVESAEPLSQTPPKEDTVLVETNPLFAPLHSTPTRMEESGEYADPLRSYASDDASSDAKPESPTVDSFSDEASFSSSLKSILLSISPYIKYKIPYLESHKGKVSPLRKYFPGKLYFSAYFPDDSKKSAFRDKRTNGSGGKNVVFKPCHKFVTLKITKGASDLSLRSSLADFRARGGTIQNICHCQRKGEEIPSPEDTQSPTEDFELEGTTGLLLTKEGEADALLPQNHQRIALLFFSFSHTFQFTSAFCVNPRVLTMDFYGRNDIPLGAFLERYCFSPSYRCLSDACQTPSLRHVRKFVHEDGCVEILLRKVEAPLDESNSSAIYMWSWCKKCREVSPVVPMSSDTWLFSFAKYLELRFHEKQMSRRGTPGCSHPVHQDHFHYFGQKDLVAVIKYIPIPIRDLVIPPAEIQYVPNPARQSLIVDMIKTVAVQGCNLFSNIMDHLATLSDEVGQRWDHLLKAVASHHQQQQQLFKESIESIQLQLTSPSFEKRLLDPVSPASNQELSAIMYGILDQVIILKRLIVQVVQDWNAKVQDLVALRKKDEKERLRTNSGNLAKQASTGSTLSFHSTLTGSAEHLNVSSKDLDEASAPPPTTNPVLSSDPSLESTPEGEKPQGSSDDYYRKSTSSTSSQGNSSMQSASQPVFDEESTGATSGQQCLTSLIQSLREERNTILRKLDVILNAASPPKFSTPIIISPAHVVQQLTSSNSETEKDIIGGLQAVTGVQNEELFPKRTISGSSDAVASPFRSGLHYMASPKGFHERSLSDDGEVVFAKEALEKVPEKRYSSSVKNIISTLWSSSVDLMVTCPFDLNEHYTLLPEVKVPIVIYDDEPSSIIAKALASQEYETQLQFLKKRLSESPQGSESGRVSESQSAPFSSTGENSSAQEGSQGIPTAKLNDSEKLAQEDFHIDIQWSDQHANYYCKILFVEQFRQLRQVVFPYGEEYFVRSLSRCVIWHARGGKSGSFFCKTTDDRFILKEMSKFEINSFLKFAPSYIQYLTNCKIENKPTTLTRIVGVYRIGFKNSTTNKAMKLDLLVMENLFYQRCIGPKFDLKGSVRNRKVNLTGKEESEVVLLDENLLQMACSSPFYLRPHGKSVLKRAIAADSAFLSQQLIMDYSLLVGIDENSNQLVVGIIDYIRTFTWDKKLETIFKGSVLGAGTGKLPTVISPELYRNRFCHAMESYFAVSPDRWSGLGLSFDS